MSNDKKKNFKKSDYKGTNKSRKQWKDHNDTKTYNGKNGQDNRKCIDEPQVHNDLNWYVHSAEEAVQLGSIPFNAATGVPIDLNGDKYTVSGVMRLNTCPVYGMGADALSAINVASRAVYAMNRKVNSGASNYTATAYSFYLFAFDSIYYLINHIKRAFATFNTYNTYNRYLPKVLLEAMGFNYEDMANNFPGHVARLNQIIRRVAVFNVPSVFPIFERHAFLFSNVMRDSKGKQTQLYFHQPTKYYEYVDVVKEGEGSALIAHDLDWGINLGPANVSQWLELLEDLVNKCYESEIFQIMNGDTQKCFGDNVFKLSLITGYEELTFIDDEMVKTQVMNATMVGKVRNADITERLDSLSGDFYLVHNPTYTRWPQTFNGPDAYLDHVINMYMDPTPANVIEAMRNIIPYGTAPSEEDFVSVGNKSEVIESANIFTIEGDGTISDGGYTFVKVFQDGPQTVTQPKWWEFVRRVSAFDYAPPWIPVYSENLQITTAEGGIMGSNVIIRNENWTVIPESQVNILDEIAIQKLFGF